MTSTKNRLTSFLKQFLSLLFLSFLAFICATVMSMINEVNQMLGGDGVITGFFSPLLILFFLFALLAYGCYCKHSISAEKICMNFPWLLTSAVILVLFMFYLEFIGVYPPYFQSLSMEVNFFILRTVYLGVAELICMVVSWLGFYGTKYLLSRRLEKTRATSV